MLKNWSLTFLTEKLQLCLRLGLKLKNTSCIRIQQKRYLKWSSKPSYMSQKLFGNNLMEIGKNKVTLALDKPAYVSICILELSKVLMC